MALQWFTYENPLRAISTNIHSPPPNKLARINCSSLKRHVGHLISALKICVFKCEKWRWSCSRTFAREGLLAPRLRLSLTGKLRVTFQVMIPLLSCEGEERRHRLKKNKAGPVCGEGWTLRSIGQPAVIGQRSGTGDWPLPSQKKSPIRRSDHTLQSSTGWFIIQQQTVCLSLCLYLFFSRCWQPQSPALGEATFRHQDGTAMKASGVVRQVQPQDALLKKNIFKFGTRKLLIPNSSDRPLARGLQTFHMCKKKKKKKRRKKKKEASVKIITPQYREC